MHRTLVSSTLILTLALVGGCKVAPDQQSDTGLVPDETGGNDDPTDDPSGDGDPTGGTGDGDGCSEALDILLVVDNSGSMADVQRRLAVDIAGLTGPLDAAGVDWRIGVTTSDNGNPWCPAGTTTPEGGKLVLSACTTRLGDFLFGNDVDVQDYACNEICDVNGLEILGTTTEYDASASPRPWIEKIGGQTNVGGNVSVEQALRCVLPMGVNGCGFESQLESGYLALARMQLSDEQSYGFLRSNAGLLVVFVSDEADCSYNKNWAEIFDDGGNKVFWSDPTAAFPTSALCWNAGVACTGDPSGYSSCVAADYDVNGSPTTNPDDAVLLPVSRYTEQIADILATKKALDSGAMVRVSLIAGTGPNGEVVYADAVNDPAFQQSFGIGPGCTAPGEVSAVPPVRMREVALDANGTLRSVCESNYAPLLTQIVEPFVENCG